MYVVVEILSVKSVDSMRRKVLQGSILPLLILSLLAMFQSGCRSCSGGGEQAFDIPDSLKDVGPQVVLSESVIKEMTENIASPVETSALIRRLGVDFDKDLLIPTDILDNFNTNFEKALALGLYGTDLGYLNMYEKTSMVVSSITAVKSLADGIQVGQFFDFNTLKRLATNNENLDSLIYISQQSYNKIDNFLRSTNRSSLSVVIVSGVWIEGMYLSARIAQSTGNEQMIESIADQKVVLGTLYPLLRAYEADPNIKALADRLDVLRGLYDQVKITYEKADPEARLIDGVLTFIQKDKQFIEASPELMDQIINEFVSLRNELITK